MTMVSVSSYPPTEMFLIKYSLQATVHSIWREHNSSQHEEQPKMLVFWANLWIKPYGFICLQWKQRVIDSYVFVPNPPYRLRIFFYYFIDQLGVRINKNSCNRHSFFLLNRILYSFKKSIIILDIWGRDVFTNSIWEGFRDQSRPNYIVWCPLKLYMGPKVGPCRSHLLPKIRTRSEMSDTQK